jgi:hypothetical protein
LLTNANDIHWSIFATCIYTIFYSLHVSLFSVM